MYLLFALACLYIALQIPPLIPFSNIISISLSVNNSNFTLVFFKHVIQDNPGADKKCTESSLYISRHLYLKLSNISASNIVSL